MNDCFAVTRENPGNVFNQTAAGDMRHALNGKVAQQVENGFDINPGRSQQGFAQSFVQFRQHRIKTTIDAFVCNASCEGIAI